MQVFRENPLFLFVDDPQSVTSLITENESSNGGCKVVELSDVGCNPPNYSVHHIGNSTNYNSRFLHTHRSDDYSKPHFKNVSLNRQVNSDISDGRWTNHNVNYSRSGRFNSKNETIQTVNDHKNNEKEKLLEKKSRSNNESNYLSNERWPFKRKQSVDDIRVLKTRSHRMYETTEDDSSMDEQRNQYYSKSVKTNDCFYVRNNCDALGSSTKIKSNPENCRMRFSPDNSRGQENVSNREDDTCNISGNTDSPCYSSDSSGSLKSNKLIDRAVDQDSGSSICMHLKKSDSSMSSKLTHVLSTSARKTKLSISGEHVEKDDSLYCVKQELTRHPSEMDERVEQVVSFDTSSQPSPKSKSSVKMLNFERHESLTSPCNRMKHLSTRTSVQHSSGNKMQQRPKSAAIMTDVKSTLNRNSFTLLKSKAMPSNTITANKTQSTVVREPVNIQSRVNNIPVTSKSAKFPPLNKYSRETTRYVKAEVSSKTPTKRPQTFNPLLNNSSANQTTSAKVRTEEKKKIKTTPKQTIIYQKTDIIQTEFLSKVPIRTSNTSQSPLIKRNAKVIIKKPITKENFGQTKHELVDVCTNTPNELPRMKSFTISKTLNLKTSSQHSNEIRKPSLTSKQNMSSERKQHFCKESVSKGTDQVYDIGVTVIETVVTDDEPQFINDGLSRSSSKNRNPPRIWY